MLEETAGNRNGAFGPEMAKHAAQIDKFCQYYVRGADWQGQPKIGMVCLAKFGDKYARGISICSVDENFSKIEARNKAQGRCVKAWRRGESSGLAASPRRSVILLRGRLFMDYDWRSDMPVWKSAWDVQPTGFERRLLKEVP